MERAEERTTPVGTGTMLVMPDSGAAEASSASSASGSKPLLPRVTAVSSSPELDLDVTVIAFAQWVSEMKSRQNSSHQQMQAEMNVIRNAITSNSSELSDFKRHSASVQQQMQNEMFEIRESLSTVFMEITSAVRNNAAVDQETRTRIQEVSEQAVRNETSFAQLADAADQSQSKLRNAVQEMQSSSERLREELSSLTRFNENMETGLGDRYSRIAVDIDQVGNDMHLQLDRRKDHLKKMLNDVMLIGESLHNLVSDFGDQKRSAFDVQNKLQSNIYVLDQIIGSTTQDQIRGRAAQVSGEAVRAMTPARPPLEGLTPVGTLPAGSMAVSAIVRPVQSVVYH
jgi:hypothetical protein